LSRTLPDLPALPVQFRIAGKQAGFAGEAG